MPEFFCKILLTSPVDSVECSHDDNLVSHTRKNQGDNFVFDLWGSGQKYQYDMAAQLPARTRSNQQEQNWIRPVPRRVDSVGRRNGTFHAAPLYRMTSIIRTTEGDFKRTAWTGGDTPTPEFLNSWIGRCLVDFFMRDQIEDCGGMENLKNWVFGADTVEDKLALFKNRAELDAWASFKNPHFAF